MSALGVFQQAKEFVNTQACLPQQRAQSAQSQFVMQRDGQNRWLTRFPHMEVATTNSQALPSCFLKRLCRFVPTKCLVAVAIFNPPPSPSLQFPAILGCPAHEKLPTNR